MSDDQAFHQYMWTYISDYIKFADQKAGVLTTVDVALIGYFAIALRNVSLHKFTIVDYGMLLGIVLLVVSTCFLIGGVIWPRYHISQRYYLSWVGICSFDSSQEYLRKLQQAQDDEYFVADMALQTYQLSMICSRKYLFLRIGFIWFVPGIILGSMFWFFS